MSSDKEEFKIGQKKDCPPPGAGTRVFYESLYKQNPKSMMALKWCLEFGVLPRNDCKKLLAKLEDKKAKHKEALKLRASGVTVKKEKPKKKKVRVEEDDGEEADADFENGDFELPPSSLNDSI